MSVLAGAATFAIGQFAFAMARTPLIRLAIAFLYTTPAAIAGYSVTLGLAHIGLAHIGVPSGGWREAFAVVGAILVGAAAFARVSSVAPPAVGQGVEDRARPAPWVGVAGEG